MAKGASYRVKLRRRRSGKTDYQARKGMVISGRPRLVTRPSNKNAYAQIVVAKSQGDQTLAAASSHELVNKYGWKAPTGNIPTAYLTGLLCGLKAKTAGIDEAILDLGLINPTKGARVFAVLHGVIDAGLEIPHGEGKIAKDRSKGDHIARYAKDLSGEQEVYVAKFSKYNAAGIAPEKVTQHFSEVRAAIVASFKGAEVAPEPESVSEPKAKPKHVPKQEAKVAPAPRAEAKAPPAPPKEAHKAEAPAKPKAEAKEAKPEAPKAEVKAAGKVEAKPNIEAEEKPKAKAAKEKAALTKEASKAKAPAKDKPGKEEKAAPKGKASKAKAPSKKAPAEKATKKGEKKQ